MSFVLDCARELRRLGADLELLDELFADASITPDAMLRWLRWLPTGIGEPELRRRIAVSAAEGGPRIALDSADLSPFEPGHADPEMDMLVELEREMSRTILPALRADGADEMHGFSVPTGDGAAEALDNLRRLPDGASVEEVMNALKRPPYTGDSPETR